MSKTVMYISLGILGIFLILLGIPFVLGLLSGLFSTVFPK